MRNDRKRKVGYREACSGGRSLGWLEHKGKNIADTVEKMMKSFECFNEEL